MKKRGFTLVELLAVVAILSLLVIIALPNIMELFNEAKENSFLTECKQIYKVSQQQWMSDSMFSTEERIYSRCNNCTGKQLSLSGREEISYYVSLNKAGKVTTLQVTDGTFQYVYSGDELKIEDIVEAERVAGLPNNEVITIKPAFSGDIYIAYDGNLKIGQPIPASTTYYQSYNELREVSTRPVFLKHKVVNNVVKESYLGVELNGTLEYFRGGPGGPSYESTLNHIKTFFENRGCFSTTSGEGCKVNYIQVYAGPAGWISADRVGGCYIGCYISANGESYCSPLDVVC